MTSRDTVLRGVTTGHFSPGGSGEFPTTVPRLDRDLFSTRGDLSSGVSSMFRPNAKGILTTTITVQGLNTVMNHAHVVDVLIPGEIGIIHQVTGRLVVDEARKSMESDFTRPPIDTGDTHRSIHARLMTTPNTTITDVGPTTFYSPLIEFGLGPHFRYGPRPFMSLAFAKVLPFYLEALHDLAKVASVPRARFGGRDYGPPANSFLAKFRGWLYTVEKQLGDIIPFGGFPGLSGTREAALGGARVLGDVQSVVGRAVGARFVRRLEGKVSGRLIGIGSNTIFARQQFAATITGGERVYNRWAGQHMSRFIGQNRSFGGG